MARPSNLTPALVRKAAALRAKGCGVRECAERLKVGKTQLAAALAALAVATPEEPVAVPPSRTPAPDAPRVPPPGRPRAPAPTQVPPPAPVAPPKAKPKARPAPPAPPPSEPPPPPPPPSSPATKAPAPATPLTIARDLLTGLTDGLVGVDPDSPAYVRLSGEARQCTKLIAALEREAAGEETAEEVERRRRREDGETRKEIERYVDQALGIALRPGPEAPHGRCPTCAVALTAEGRTALTGGAS